jgi:hypothetical protein
VRKCGWSSTRHVQYNIRLVSKCQPYYTNIHAMACTVAAALAPRLDCPLHQHTRTTGA